MSTEFIQQTKNKPASSVKATLYAIFGVLAFAAVGLQLMLGAYYQGKIYPGVQVSNVSVGNLTRTQAVAKLSQSAKKFQLDLAVGSHHYKVAPSDLGTQYNLQASADTAYLVGRDEPLTILGLIKARHQGRVGYAFTVDKEAQDRFIDKVISETGEAPIDATVVVNNGVPQAQSDKNGQSVRKAELISALEEAIGGTVSSTIALAPKTEAADVKTADTAQAIEEAKKFMAVPVTLTYNDKTFKPTPAQIGSWIVFEKTTVDDKPELVAKIDAGKVKDYVLQVAAGINVAAVNQIIKVENGVSSQEREGVNGLVVDDGPVTEAVADAVGQLKAVTVAIPTKPIAFKTQYNRIITLDYGKYIEVNLSRQHMWVYQDHQVIFDSPITSGATGAGFPTVQGLFSIYAKQTDRNLNGYAIGYNYNVFVKYWMPFYGNYGLHDASWRSSFGGSDYYYGGSHGCVNMPESSAAFLYGWADVGTPVWVHS
jgi:lipoprotein-anchoring transpeptidase ErfK/SrfK